MKYAIIGTGAVGGYYGALLNYHGFETHFLLHKDYNYVKKHGLLIESINGNFQLPNINAYYDAEQMPECDVVLIALKTTQNHLLQNILPYVVKKNGIVVVLQNGLGVEQQISQIIPHACVIGGLCFLCSNKIGPGHIKHIDYGTIRIGEYKQGNKPAGITENLKLIADNFQKSGIDIILSDNLGKSRWEKLVWNISFNGVSVILNATTDKIMACTFSYQMIQELMIEVITAANHCGFSVEHFFADDMIKLTKEMASYNPSMKLDFENGKALEINEIYWEPINQAKSSGYEMVKSRIIAMQLEFLNKHNLNQ